MSPVQIYSAQTMESLVHGDLHLYWGGQRVIKIEVSSKKPPQKMPTSDTTEWKETCWKLLHGREMSLLPWPHNCFCDGEQRPSLSLHAWEGCVSLSSRIACCPHQYFSQAMVHSRSVPPLLLNKTEWKIQGLWDMGVSHVKPLKFSTRTGWLCSNPSCLLVHPWA